MSQNSLQDSAVRAWTRQGHSMLKSSLGHSSSSISIIIMFSSVYLHGSSPVRLACLRSRAEKATGANNAKLHNNRAIMECRDITVDGFLQHPGKPASDQSGKAVSVLNALPKILFRTSLRWHDKKLNSSSGHQLFLTPASLLY